MHPFRRTLKRVFGVVFINDRKDVRLLFNCFLAATIFWLVNALQKDYKEVFTLPVLFSYDVTKFTPSDPLPKTINIELKASGWNLVQKNLGIGKDTVYIIPELPFKQYITLEDLEKTSSNGIAGASIEKIEGDSLHFKFISQNK